MKLVKSFILAAAAAFSASAALACEALNVQRFQFDGAVYVSELNGVYLDHSTEPSDASGGGPFNQWLVAGENTYSISVTAGSANVQIQRVCRGEFDGEMLVEATVNAGETRELTFFVDDAPSAPYDGLGPIAKDGLPEALGRMKTAVAKKKFNNYWRFIEGVRMAAEAQGVPIEQMKPQLKEIIENSNHTFAKGLRYKPVMGGRVWQVLGPNHEPPILIEHAEDGSRISISTGAFWTKINGEWRVVGM